MKVNVLLLAIILVLASSACKPKTNSQETVSTLQFKAEKIEVLYFHFSRRCATCNAVESVTQQTVADFYGDSVAFRSINLDEPEGKAIGDELKVSGQTLLIVADGKKIDITNEGFMNARNNPDVLRQAIKDKIDPLL